MQNEDSRRMALARTIRIHPGILAVDDVQVTVNISNPSGVTVIFMQVVNPAAPARGREGTRGEDIHFPVCSMEVEVVSRDAPPGEFVLVHLRVFIVYDMEPDFPSSQSVLCT